MKFSALIVYGAVSVAANADVDAPAFVRKTQAACAIEGQRSQECGALDPNRPAVCCEGLFCQFAKCVSNVGTCAEAGTKAKECGVNQVNRPDLCCPGLICDELKFCVPADSIPTALPTISPVPTASPTGLCAGELQRARDCGAAAEDRPQSCCGTLVCEGGAGVRCIVDPNAPAPTAPAPTEAAPTMGEAAPVMAPTEAAAAPVMAPTEAEAAPVMAPTEAEAAPVMAPTEAAEPIAPEPTMGETAPEPTAGAPAPTSSAGKITATLAVVAAFASSLLL